MKLADVKILWLAVVVASTVLTACGTEESSYSLVDTADNSNIRVKIGVESAEDTFLLYFATSDSVEKMWYCGGNDVAGCNESAGQPAEFVNSKEGVKFFKSSTVIKAVNDGVLTLVGKQPEANLTQVVQFKKASSTTTATNNVSGYNWREHIQFTDVPSNPFNGADVGSEYYLDVMNHTKDRWMQSEHPTNSHETMHGMLNEMGNATSAKDQFVYHEKGKGAYFSEPEMHASKIKNYLPAAAKRLARSRADLYLGRQVSAYFPNVGYQFDEWEAYVTNGFVGIQMFESGKWNTGGQDIVDGSMDFLYFCSAALLALHVNETQYIQSNTQFKAVYAMLAEKTMYIVKKGLTMDPFDGFHAKELMEHFVSSPENEDIREGIKMLYGDDWTQRVFGF